MANSDMRNPARSDNMCAASVMMARLPAKYPPVCVCGGGGGGGGEKYICACTDVQYYRKKPWHLTVRYVSLRRSYLVNQLSEVYKHVRFWL